MNQKTTLIPIGGGKGGVGKSLTAANLSAALAELGKKVVLVDLDMGGANLYSYLGLQNNKPGIGDFLLNKQGRLCDYQTDTGQPGLSYIPGDGRTPFMANLLHVQKVKLCRELKSLQADYVILDIGAGSSFNTIDFFSLAPHGMLLTTPDSPALMNMLAFLKSFVLRTILARIKKHPGTEPLIRVIQRQTISSSLLTVEMIRNRLLEIAPLAAQEVDRITATCRPRVVFNFTDSPDDLQIAHPVGNAAGSQLSLRFDWFGLLHYDPAVRRSLQRKRLLLSDAPTSLFAAGIRRLAEQVIDSWDRQSDMSFELLQASSHSFHRRWQPNATAQDRTKKSGAR